MSYSSTISRNPTGSPDIDTPTRNSERSRQPRRSCTPEGRVNNFFKVRGIFWPCALLASFHMLCLNGTPFDERRCVVVVPWRSTTSMRQLFSSHSPQKYSRFLVSRVLTSTYSEYSEKNSSCSGVSESG